MNLAESYSGRFDPRCCLADLSRSALAQLGREYMLMGHLIDRVGLPLIMARLDEAAMTQLSIDEWMGASPVYSKRMQEALGFAGDDVAALFKNLQLDIGAPHQFMDFQFRLDRPDYGEFWLSHCGALMDVEPWGQDRVHAMCHDIEDPTFDATAAAVNPRMKMRAIHRPPRSPAGRYPHCHWRVFIDDEAAPYEQHENLPLVEASLLATVPLAGAVPSGGAGAAGAGGWDDYSGTFDPGFQLEDLSQAALVAVVQEFAVQAHLLVRSFLMAVGRRFGDEVVAEVSRGQWVGSAALAAQRLVRTLLPAGSPDRSPARIEAVAKVFQLHPHFQPRTYLDLDIRVTGPATVRLGVGDCPALHEGDLATWFAALDDPGAVPAAFDAIAGAVDPQARCVPVAPDGRGGAVWACDVIIDDSAPPAEPPAELALARMSTGADFELMQRRPLRVTAEQ